VIKESWEETFVSQTGALTASYVRRQKIIAPAGRNLSD
jgi:hypothetical protein